MPQKRREIIVSVLPPRTSAQDQPLLVTHHSKSAMQAAITKFQDTTLTRLTTNKNLLITFPFNNKCPGPDVCPYNNNGMHEHRDKDACPFDTNGEQQHQEGTTLPCPLSLRAHFWVWRRDTFLSERCQHILWEGYHLLLQRCPEIFKTTTSSINQQNNRSSYNLKPLLLGYWRPSARESFFTSDTLQGGDATRQRYIMRFMAAIDYVLLPLKRKVKEMDLGAHNVCTKICNFATVNDYKTLRPSAITAGVEQVQTKYECEFNAKPLRLGLMGTTLQVSKGFAERRHIDFHDWNERGAVSYSFSIDPSGWGGGAGSCQLAMDFPNLGYRILIQSGQLLAFTGGDLLHGVHCESQDVAASERLNFTFFVNQDIARDTVKRFRLWQ